MANRPANAGAHSADPRRGSAATPPPVHHQDFPRKPGNPRTPGIPQTRRAARARPATQPVLAWLLYLVVLAGTAVGLLVASGAGQPRRGAGVVGGVLLVAAAARLVLPPRYAGLLASRGKALDVTIFAVLGAALLGVAISLP